MSSNFGDVLDVEGLIESLRSIGALGYGSSGSTNFDFGQQVESIAEPLSDVLSAGEVNLLRADKVSVKVNVKVDVNISVGLPVCEED